VAAVKCRPVLHHCVVILFWSSGTIDCLHLKIEFRSCARGRPWCGIFHFHWWTASIKPRLLFSHSGLVSWGLPFLQFNLSLLEFSYMRCHSYTSYAFRHLGHLCQVVVFLTYIFNHKLNVVNDKDQSCLNVHTRTRTHTNEYVYVCNILNVLIFL